MLFKQEALNQDLPGTATVFRSFKTPRLHFAGPCFSASPSVDDDDSVGRLMNQRPRRRSLLFVSSAMLAAGLVSRPLNQTPGNVLQAKVGDAQAPRQSASRSAKAEGWYREISQQTEFSQVRLGEITKGMDKLGEWYI